MARRLRMPARSDSLTSSPRVAMLVLMTSHAHRHEPSEDAIRKLAYHISQSWESGTSEDNWLRAERILRSSLVRVNKVTLPVGSPEQTREEVRAVLDEEFGLVADQVWIQDGFSSALLLIELALAPFFAAIMTEFGKDTYLRLKRFVKRLHRVEREGRYHQGLIGLMDPETLMYVNFSTEEPLPDEAYAALLDIDLEAIGIDLRKGSGLRGPQKLVWDGEAWLVERFGRKTKAPKLLDLGRHSSGADQMDG